MRRLDVAVLCALSVLVAASAAAQPTVVTINGNPLTVIVGSDTSFQLVNSQFPGNGQIYPGSCTNSVADAGIFASINGTLYGPNFLSHPCGSAAIQPTPWTPVSISGVTGTGTSSDPFKVTVVGDAGTTGVRLTVVFSYVNGEGFYRLTKTFCSSTQSVTMNVYVGADIYLAGSDAGIPYLEPTSSSPGGKDCSNTGYTILLVPTTPATHFSARGYSIVWSEIAAQGNLSDVVDTGCIDNGAALEWANVSVAAGSCTTITSASSFGAVPSITQFSVGAVSPNAGNPGQTLTVIVSGIGFQPGTTFNFGPGITVNSTTINGSSQATVQITIASNAAPGPRDVTGTQSPTSGLTSTAAGAFTVNGAPPSSCPSAPANLLPAGAGARTSGLLTWGGTASSYNVFFGPGTGGCSTPFATTSAHSVRYTGLAPNAMYSFRVEANTTGCPIVSSPCVSFSTTTSTPCRTSPPTLLSPAPGATNVASPVTFVWTAQTGAVAYQLWISTNGQPALNAGTTNLTQLTVDVAPGPVLWFVIAKFACGGSARSAFASFNSVPGCGTPDAPVAGVIALVRSGENFHLTWKPVANADTYEVDAATTPAFTDATTSTTTQTSLQLHQTVDKATALWFRVRARNTPCNTVSASSLPVRTVVVPIDSSSSTEFTLSTEFGNVTPMSQQVLVKPPAGALSALATTTFHATTDRPWLTVTPTDGTMTANGVLFTITADPRGQHPGSTTGTLIVTTQTTASATTPPVTVPVSISLATPVTPAITTGPSPNSLIIPAVAHVDGLSSVWRSDVRLANLAGATNTYRLLLSLTTGAGTTVNEADADVAPGQTLALDDVVKNWFGFGPLGDGANAVLEIRPSDAALARSSTAATSRTYNATVNGTLGQFIPAIPFGQFIFARGESLALQPITQSASFRTNFGFVEATGHPANVVATLFDAAGKQLFQQTFSLHGGDQLQLSGLLAQNNVSVDNGWMDVKIDGQSDGKITAYASVVDNGTGDGNVFIGTDPVTVASNHYVVAGVGRASGSNWQSDVTLLNHGTTAVDAKLTLVEQGSAGRPAATVHIEPQQVAALTNVVETEFGVHDALGALLVDVPAATPLVISGKTYNVSSNGTLGEALRAFTSNDAVALNGRSLEILNIEESDRYRSNLGLAELSGQPVTVEITGHGDDVLVSPTITVDLGANDFVQMSSILKQLGFDRTYNGRISVTVAGGSGSVAAYVSTVDNRTNDPTYLPAQ